MKKIVIIGVICTSLLPVASAKAAPFKNCTALRVVYPDGVAKSASAAKKQKGKPKISAAIYKTHAKMDRDDDGTAREKWGRFCSLLF